MKRQYVLTKRLEVIMDKLTDLAKAGNAGPWGRYVFTDRFKLRWRLSCLETVVFTRRRLFGWRRIIKIKWDWKWVWLKLEDLPLLVQCLSEIKESVEERKSAERDKVAIEAEMIDSLIDLYGGDDIDVQLA